MPANSRWPTRRKSHGFVRIRRRYGLHKRAVVDRVIATSGRLSVEEREAEGLLEALREERELTQGIHDALKELRREESETVHVDFGKREA